MISKGFGSYGHSYGGLVPFGTVSPTMLVPIPGASPVSGWAGPWGAARFAKATNPMTGKTTKFLDVRGRGGFHYMQWHGKGVQGDISIVGWPKNDVPPASERYLRKKDRSARWVAITGEIATLVPSGAASAGDTVGSLLNALLPAVGGKGKPGRGGRTPGDIEETDTGSGFMDGPGKYVVIGGGALLAVGLLVAVLK